MILSGALIMALGALFEPSDPVNPGNPGNPVNPSARTEPIGDASVRNSAAPDELNPTPPADTPAPAADDEADDPLEYLGRAQALEADGDLAAAEAEVSVAIALQPGDPAAYLARAQIRMKMSERASMQPGPSLPLHRIRAVLLRQAAEDLAAYLAYAVLPEDSRIYLDTRRGALLREAEALAPSAPTSAPAAAPPEPRPTPRPTSSAPRIASPARPDARGDEPRARALALALGGGVMSVAGAGLSAASLRIAQTCDVDDSRCRVRWETRPSLLAPSATLTALGTAALVLGIVASPPPTRDRRRRLGGTTLALGSAAGLVGAATGGLAARRWRTTLSASDDAALRSTQALGNAAAVSLSLAVPLVSAGLTTLLRRRDGEPR